MCPFKLVGAEWVQCDIIFQIWAICLLEDMSPQSPQKHLTNCRKKLLIQKAQNAAIEEKIHITNAIRTPPILYKAWTKSVPRALQMCFF